MNPVRSYFAAIAVLAGCLGGPVWADSGTISTPDFVVEFQDVERGRVESFVRLATMGKQSVVGFLGRPYPQPIRVSIADVHGYPRFDSSSNVIAVPASRIRGDAKGPPNLKGRGTAIIQVLTKLIAPSRNRTWGTFLETGLGVYMQERFGDDADPSFPNMGRDLHQETASHAANFGRLILLEHVERERTATTGFRRSRTLAHLEEGSFVRFLIEFKGLEKFMKFYDGVSVREAYGVEFKEFESKWSNMIRAKQKTANQ